MAPAQRRQALRLERRLRQDAAKLQLECDGLPFL